MITSEQIEANALFTFTVDHNNSIHRIDQYISSLFPHYSRTFFQQLINEHHVSRNGTVTTKPSTPVMPHDIITIQFPPARVVEPNSVSLQTMNVSVIKTTEHFMIIYKPPHLLVHPPSKMSSAITLTDWIKQNHQEIARVGAVDRPGIVHRLDKNTSGIMIVTRTNYGHTIFHNLFKNRTISKTYLAIVSGHPAQQGTISLSIGRNPFDRTKMATFNEGNHDEIIEKHSIKIRPAFTEYKVLQYFEDTALVEVKPKTGRTHQIRVHMAAIGHPIIGDEMYGQTSTLIARQALHAHSLSFSFDNKDYSFSNEIPEDMQQLLRNLKSTQQ